MAKENTTTNHIENEADNVDSDDLEVSTEAVVFTKHWALTQLVDVELRTPHEPSHCCSILHIFKDLDIEYDVPNNLRYDSDGNETPCATPEYSEQS